MWIGPGAEVGVVLLVYQLWIGEPGRWKLRTRSVLLKDGVKIRRAGIMSLLRGAGSVKLRVFG